MIHWEDDDRKDSIAYSNVNTYDNRSLLEFEDQKTIGDILKEFIIEEREQWLLPYDLDTQSKKSSKQHRTSHLTTVLPAGQKLSCRVTYDDDMDDNEYVHDSLTCYLFDDNMMDECTDDKDVSDITSDGITDLDFSTNNHMDKVIDNQVYRKFGYV